MNFTPARQGWMINHSICSKIISDLLQEINFSVKDDVSKELLSYHVEKDSNDLHNIIDTIRKLMNPFNSNINNENLFS